MKIKLITNLSATEAQPISKDNIDYYRSNT